MFHAKDKPPKGIESHEVLYNRSQEMVNLIKCFKFELASYDSYCWAESTLSPAAQSPDFAAIIGPIKLVAEATAVLKVLGRRYWKLAN